MILLVISKAILPRLSLMMATFLLSKVIFAYILSLLLKLDNKMNRRKPILILKAISKEEWL